MKLSLILTLLLASQFIYLSGLNAKPVKVHLDTSEVPHLKEWGEKAKQLIIEWHPRIQNLIPSEGFEPPTEVSLKIKKTDKGVGSTSGTKITISSHWIEKKPTDFGLVFHELVHVIQRYPSGKPWWVTEGIADYLRWGIYEAKPQSWFPRPKDKTSYKKGYQVTGGFFLWLETTTSPGIVNKLNAAMRKKEYSNGIFKKETGKSLEELWIQYSSE